jgi:hypothetical protein
LPLLARLRVLELQMQLGERERPFDHRARVDADELEPAAVRRGERPRRDGLAPVPSSVDPFGARVGRNVE